MGHRLLIVIDFQHDFVDGALGFPKAKDLVQPIAEKIKAYEASGDDIIFTLDTHSEAYLSTEEGKNLPVNHCIKGTTGHALYGKIEALSKNHPKLEKDTFGSRALFEYIRNSRYEQIELVGLVSNICVIANAILAKTARPEAHIVVDANATASYDDQLHEKSLDIMEGLHIEIVGRKKSNEP